MNLDRFEELLPRFKIRDRESHRIIPFRMNPNQRRMIDILKKRQTEGLPLWMIVLKSRRVGISTLAEALLFTHCLSTPNARALVVAHLSDTAQALFEMPLGFVRSLPFSIPEPTQKIIRIPHTGAPSTLRFATHSSVRSGRGLSLSALHLSEAAHSASPSGESFAALLPAVSRNKNTICIIESTANGKDGQGREFYERWSLAEQGRGDFEPVFLSFLEDPGCRRDPEEAEDAPANDFERELMSDFKADKATVAWVRSTLETECGGYLPKFNQEYPHTASVAFVASGNPAFGRDELSWSNTIVREPLYRAEATIRDGLPCLARHSHGAFHVWEEPQPGATYYIGIDAAKGQEDGDFAAMYGWNGSTGETAFRMAERVNPEHLARDANIAGRYYNQAMLVPEMTGGWGAWTYHQLRDKHIYPNMYGWKGKDDRLGGAFSPKLGGWETTARTRQLMFDSFRASIRLKEISPRDRALVQQMDAATMVYWRWEIERGHDDILIAAMIAHMACCQYPPITGRGKARQPAEEEENAWFWKPDSSEVLSRHYERVRSVGYQRQLADERDPGWRSKPLM